MYETYSIQGLVYGKFANPCLWATVRGVETEPAIYP